MSELHMTTSCKLVHVSIILSYNDHDLLLSWLVKEFLENKLLKKRFIFRQLSKHMSFYYIRTDVRKYLHKKTIYFLKFCRRIRVFNTLVTMVDGRDFLIYLPLNSFEEMDSIKVFDFTGECIWLVWSILRIVLVINSPFHFNYDFKTVNVDFRTF